MKRFINILTTLCCIAFISSCEEFDIDSIQSPKPMIKSIEASLYPYSENYIEVQVDMAIYPKLHEDCDVTISTRYHTYNADVYYGMNNGKWRCKIYRRDFTNNENNICREVTYERIKRVIDKEGYAASLKYFKVDYIPVSERMYYEYADELLAHIRELVELENGINFTGNAEVGIVLTDDKLNEFIQNGEAFAKCRKLYMGHDLLPDEEQEKILRARGIEISIIPDYYYRDLQEV